MQSTVLISVCLYLFALSVQLSQASEQKIIRISKSSTPSNSNQLALLDLHKTLINIESISGNEHAIGAWLASFLGDQGFTVELQEVSLQDPGLNKKPRYNVFAYRGSRGTPVLVTSHIDTVPPFYKHTVYNGTKIWGRGSVDAKGCIAAQIIALLSLLNGGVVSDDDVALLFVVGEEVNGDGMLAANDLDLKWETVIFGEPTDLKLAAGHKGAMAIEITSHGKSGHSGYPELGENAISMLLPALVALQNLSLPKSDKYGNSTLNIGRVEGGVAANVIPEKAYAAVQIRLAAGVPQDIKDQVERVLHQIDDRLDLRFSLGYGPVSCDTDIEGFETTIVNYGTDVPNLRGIHKRYLYGPGSILVAHSSQEHLDVEDLTAAVHGYRKLIVGALKNAQQKSLSGKK